jgi:AAHS family 4-hydroxybenzoate transporter-like MFS transporter
MEAVRDAQRSWVLLGISFSLVMIDGYDLFIVSFIAPLIAKDLHLSFVNIGSVFAAGLAGSMVGGLLLGHIADRAGRRPILLVSLALVGVATLLCSQADSFGAFAALRFVAGLALGGLLAAIVPLLAEHFPPRQRSVAVTVMFIGYPLGAAIGGAITALLIGYGW